MTAAALPAAGLRPATLVLLDPPAIPLAADRREAIGGRARLAARASTTAVPRPAARTRHWPRATCEAIELADRRLDLEAARPILLENGDWDGGLADLSDPAAAGSRRLARPRRSGGRRPCAGRVAAVFAARIGADHVDDHRRRSALAAADASRPRLTAALLQALD